MSHDPLAKLQVPTGTAVEVRPLMNREADALRGLLDRMRAPTFVDRAGTRWYVVHLLATDPDA